MATVTIRRSSGAAGRSAMDAITEFATAVSSTVLGSSNGPLLPFIPRPVKLFLAFLLLLNWRSFPLVWHVRVLNPVPRLAIIDYLNRWRRRKWVDGRARIGADPFQVVLTSKRYASIDDCDYNMHLSNSSYAKMVDTTRMEAVTELFGPIMGEGPWIALGASQYSFIREIPMGTPYEIRTTFGGWEDKWWYTVHTFVSYPKTSQGKKPAPATGKIVATPATPSLVESPPPEPAGLTTTYDMPINIPNHVVKKPLPDGAVINCIAVSQYCLKIGRITIPPAVFFVACGFGDPSKDRWSHIQHLRFNARPGKSLIPDILRGGWKTDAVEGWDKSSKGEWSSFWDLPEFEERRKQRIEEVFGGWRDGLVALKGLDV